MTDWSMWNWNITSQETQSKRNASVWSKLPQQIKMLTFWQSHSLECNTGITQIRCWIEQCCRWDVLWMRSWCCCGRKLSSRNSLFTQKQHDNIQVQCKIKSKLTKITARAHMSNKIVNPISVQIGQDCYFFFDTGGTWPLRNAIPPHHPTLVAQTVWESWHRLDSSSRSILSPSEILGFLNLVLFTTMWPETPIIMVSVNSYSQWGKTNNDTYRQWRPIVIFF